MFFTTSEIQSPDFKKERECASLSSLKKPSDQGPSRTSMHSIQVTHYTPRTPLTGNRESQISGPSWLIKFLVSDWKKSSRTCQDSIMGVVWSFNELFLYSKSNECFTCTCGTAEDCLEGLRVLEGVCQVGISWLDLIGIEMHVVR